MLSLCSWENIMIGDYAIRGICQTFIMEPFFKKKLLTNNLQFSLQLQRCIQKLVENLRLSILRLLAVNYFLKTLHLRCLTELWIRLWTLLKKRYWHRFFFFQFCEIFQRSFFSNIMKAEKRHCKLTLRNIRASFSSSRNALQI